MQRALLALGLHPVKDPRHCSLRAESNAVSCSPFPQTASLRLCELQNTFSNTVLVHEKKSEPGEGLSLK